NCKTLIVVNKIELLNQWKVELIKFIPGIRVGIIQGQNFQIEECDVVIAMLQTISLKENLSSFDFNWVDLCFIDEVHNIAAESFSKIIFKVRPRYLFGLSATLERKDKMEKMIRWYLGDIIYSDISNSGKQSSEVHVYKYFGRSSKTETLWDGNVSVSRMISNIAGDRDRTELITRIIRELIQRSAERMILVISDRVSQLRFMHQLLGDSISGLFIGALDAKTLTESKTKRVLLGTYGMVNEGFNHPKLNCLIFATPRSSIIQAVGRIYRKNHSITPIIVDIHDTFSIFTPQYYKRRNFYKKVISDCVIFNKNFEPEEEQVEEVLEKLGCCLIDEADEADEVGE
ncbi:MAG: hypothetical protein EHM20_13485, partial [Alphaproteobacteria bacterium]